MSRKGSSQNTELPHALWPFHQVTWGAGYKHGLEVDKHNRDRAASYLIPERRLQPRSEQENCTGQATQFLQQILGWPKGLLAKLERTFWPTQ